ncbi:hypothetical protein F5146DRAFT_1144864 [Armillaria mellea]|nr:hypothetical protein F5146DRAFT_1144864 [Armillaria mellea]
MFLPTALAVLAATASAQYIPVIADPPDDGNSHRVSAKVCGIVVGCLFGLLFLGCFCEAIWRNRKRRRQQPDPEQPAQDSLSVSSTVPQTDGEDTDNRESGGIDAKDSVEIDDGGSLFAVPVCPPPPAYTPKVNTRISTV